MKRVIRLIPWFLCAGFCVVVLPLHAQDGDVHYSPDDGGSGGGDGARQQREGQRFRGGGGGGGGRQFSGGGGRTGGGGGAGGSFWGNMSEEERNQLRQQMQGMSQDERRALFGRLRNMSEEERARLMNATPEERANWLQQNRGQPAPAGGGGQPQMDSSGEGGGAFRGGGGRGGRGNWRGRAGGGGRSGGGSDGLVTRAAQVPEEYRTLVTNSPFMTAEYRASLTRGNAQERREIQFTGLIRPAGEWLFGLEDRRQNRTYWLQQGESEAGIEIRAFDETNQTLTVSLDGTEIVLRISNQ